MRSIVRPRIRLNLRLLPLAVGLLIFLQLIFPFQGWMILLVVLGGAWLIAYAWVHSLARNLKLTREMRFGWAQVGDRIEERFTLENTGWLPALWVEIADRSTLPGCEASRATGIDEHATNCWGIWSVCARRGAFTLGPTTLVTGDPFGIYTVSLDDPSSVSMLVMPPVIPLPEIQIAPGGSVGEGRRRIHAWERTVNAAGVRDYVPGDSQSQIHWAITAHRDVLSARVFDSTPASDWWIFLDLDQTVQVGQGQDSTLEHGVMLAASLATQGLRAGHAVGLVAHGDSLIWLAPRPGEAQRWHLLRELALVAGGSHSLENLLAQTKSAITQRSSLIVITPAAHGAWIKSLLPFRRRGVAPTVLLFDAVSFGGTSDTQSNLEWLADLEIAHHVITRSVLDRPEARPGRAGFLELRVSPLGKAIVTRRPRDPNWRVVA